MLLAVGVPLTAGAVTVAPSPLATALAVIVPETLTAPPVTPVKLACGIVEGRVMVTALVLAVVGVPVMATVTTVPLVRVTVPDDSPAGKPCTAKLAAVMVVLYVPLASV